MAAGRQARDVQLSAGHDVRPHRMAFSDPVRHAPAGRADRAQAASHLQNRLRQQVRHLWFRTSRLSDCSFQLQGIGPVS